METKNKKPSMNRYFSIIHRKFQIYLNQKLEKSGINSSEFMYLTALNHNGEMTLTELSSFLHMDNAQTTRVIGKLYARELVTKIRNSNDKREFKIALSEKGKNLIPIICYSLEGWNEIINKGLTDNEIDALTEKLKNIARNAIDAVKGEDN